MKNYDTSALKSNEALDDAQGLEFPDWSGMLPHRSRMTFEQAVKWNDEILAMFPRKKNSARFDAANRCHAEFIP